MKGGKDFSKGFKITNLSISAPKSGCVPNLLRFIILDAQNNGDRKRKPFREVFR